MSTPRSPHGSVAGSLSWRTLISRPSMMSESSVWLDLARVGAVGRVVLEQQRVHLDVDEVVDGDDLDVGGALDERLERLAADAAEAVDADANGHRVTSLRVGRWPPAAWAALDGTDGDRETTRALRTTGPVGATSGALPRPLRRRPRRRPRSRARRPDVPASGPVEWPCPSTAIGRGRGRWRECGQGVTSDGADRAFGLNLAKGRGSPSGGPVATGQCGPCRNTIEPPPAGPEGAQCHRIR